MIRSPLICRCAAVLLLAPTALVAAQDISSLLSQKNWPDSIKITDLPDGYKAVKIKLAGGGGGGSILDLFGGLSFMLLSSFSGGGGAQESQIAAMNAMGLLDISWTRGEVLKIGGADFLVTYKSDPNMGDLANLNQGVSALTNVPLRLTFVKVSDILTISPRSDLSKETFTSAQPAQPGAGGMSGSQMAAARAATLSNAKQVALGMLMYCSDYDDVYPWPQSSKTAWAVIYPYVKNQEVFSTRNPAGGEFLFNMCLGGVNAFDLDAPAETPLIFESKPWPDGKRVVAYSDGHAKTVSEEEWNALQSKLKLKLKKAAKKPLPMNYSPGGFGT